MESHPNSTLVFHLVKYMTVLVTVLYNLVSIQNKIPISLCLPSKIFLPNFTSLSVVVQSYKYWFYGMCHPVLNLCVCLCVKL